MFRPERRQVICIPSSNARTFIWITFNCVALVKNRLFYDDLILNAAVNCEKPAVRQLPCQIRVARQTTVTEHMISCQPSLYNTLQHSEYLTFPHINWGNYSHILSSQGVSETQPAAFHCLSNGGLISTNCTRMCRGDENRMVSCEKNDVFLKRRAELCGREDANSSFAVVCIVGARTITNTLYS